MARPSLNHNVALEIYRLRSLGKSIDKICEELSLAKTRGGFPYKVPARRTVGKYVKRYNELPSEVKLLDNPLEWHRFEEYGLPWESSSYLLDAWTYFNETKRRSMGVSRPSVRRARWWWRVHLAAPELVIYDTYSLAEKFVMREQVRDLLQVNEGMDDLEAQIAYKPWLSKERRGLYLLAIKEGRIPELRYSSAYLDGLRTLGGTEYGVGLPMSLVPHGDDSVGKLNHLMESQHLHIYEQIGNRASLEEAVESALELYSDYDEYEYGEYYPDEFNEDGTARSAKTVSLVLDIEEDEEGGK